MGSDGCHCENRKTYQNSVPLFVDIKSCCFEIVIGISLVLLFVCMLFGVVERALDRHGSRVQMATSLWSMET